MDELIALIGVIISLSIASERLVEIIKGFIPPLGTKAPTEEREGIRRSLLQILAVFSGILTAFLAQDYLPPEISTASSGWDIIGLGLLASGGSGFWNAILTYVAKVKDIKSFEAAKIRPFS